MYPYDWFCGPVSHMRVEQSSTKITSFDKLYIKEHKFILNRVVKSWKVFSTFRKHSSFQDFLIFQEFWESSGKVILNKTIMCVHQKKINNFVCINYLFYIWIKFSVPL